MMFPGHHLIIAIDGPAGAGKSTVGKLLAERLGALYIDTGAMYRAVTWCGLTRQILNPHSESKALTPDQERELTRLAETTQLQLEGDPFDLRILADDQDITTAIRTPEVSRFSSIVSAIPGVRAALVAQQRKMGETGSVVMDGRDIGTHVFPQAPVKIFLDASIEARSQRRFEEQRLKGEMVTLEATRKDVEERDQRDRSRAVAPLKPAEDAIVLDTSDLTVEQVVDRMAELVVQSSGEELAQS